VRKPLIVPEGKTEGDVAVTATWDGGSYTKTEHKTF